MKNLAKQRTEMWEIEVNLKFKKGMTIDRQTRWGWYRYKCWQFILNKALENASIKEEITVKGYNMLAP